MVFLASSVRSAARLNLIDTHLGHELGLCANTDQAAPVWGQDVAPPMLDGLWSTQGVSGAGVVDSVPGASRPGGSPRDWVDEQAGGCCD
jgi:hypothetical protein